MGVGGEEWVGVEGGGHPHIPTRGTSIRDFLSLTASGCRVSIRFESYGAGPADSQGFLELRKL